MLLLVSHIPPCGLNQDTFTFPELITKLLALSLDWSFLTAIRIDVICRGRTFSTERFVNLI